MRIYSNTFKRFTQGSRMEASAPKFPSSKGYRTLMQHVISCSRATFEKKCCVLSHFILVIAIKNILTV